MMKKLTLLFLTAFSPLLWANPAPATPFEGPSNKREPQLIINNRPLAKINGKVISLIDVVKRMDLFLYEYDPNMKLSAPEKIQFYSSRWEPMVEEMIYNQLAILDAEQKELKVSEGDIREEMEERFGPNVHANLEKIDLQYDEAHDLVKEDLLVRQIMWYKVHSKALQTVTPHLIRDAYQEYLQKNPPVKKLNYRVLSIRGTEESLCQKIADKAYALLSNHGKTLEEISDELKQENPSITVTVSDQLSGKTPEISEQHFQVLKNLSSESYSEPVTQISRFDQSAVTRIFYLDSIEEQVPSGFDSMHDPLKNQLLTQTADREKQVYFDMLKKRYGYHKESPRMPLPEDYQPFLIY